MQIHRHIATVTTAGGSGSTNTSPFRGGLCRQVLIVSGTTTTTFRSNLTDPDSNTVRSYSTVTGTLNDDNRILPVRGAYTLNVTNASADGNFTCMLMVEE